MAPVAAPRASRHVPKPSIARRPTREAPAGAEHPRRASTVTYPTQPRSRCRPSSMLPGRRQADGSKIPGAPPLIPPDSSRAELRTIVFSPRHAVGDVKLVGRGANHGAMPTHTPLTHTLASLTPSSAGAHLGRPPTRQDPAVVVNADLASGGRAGPPEGVQRSCRRGGRNVACLQHPVAGHVNRVRVVADGWLIRSRESGRCGETKTRHRRL